LIALQKQTVAQPSSLHSAVILLRRDYIERAKNAKDEAEALGVPPSA
jgi:hypothetical protein